MSNYVLAGQRARDDESLPDTVDFVDFDKALYVYSKLNAIDWHALWDGGGIADQDEQLWDDVMTVASLVSRLEKILEKKNPPNESAHQ